MRSHTTRRFGTTALALALATSLAACSGDDDTTGDEAVTGDTETAAEQETAGDAAADEEEPAGDVTEDAEPADEVLASAPAGPRVVVTYEGGVAVLDAASLDLLSTSASESFVRVNPVGDGQHVMVTTSEGFQVLDTGADSGDDPLLTETVFPAGDAGHVVHHEGQTLLWDDATGDTVLFPTSALAETDGIPETEVIEAEDAHHGVSVELSDGTFLATVGDADGRSGARAMDGNGEVVAESDACPGVHGEGVAADEVVLFGCEDGVLLFRDGAFTKIDAGPGYARTGNVYVAKDSRLVVGDFRADPDAETVELSDITLIDTEADTLEVVALPEGVGYTWRGISRGPDAMAYLLGTDGSLHVIDPATGEITDSWPVVETWQGPADWQEPHPALVIHESTAYVTEPAADAVHAVDLATGEVTATGDVGHAPNEITVATG